MDLSSFSFIQWILSIFVKSHALIAHRASCSWISFFCAMRRIFDLPQFRNHLEMYFSPEYLIIFLYSSSLQPSNLFFELLHYILFEILFDIRILQIS